jgi:glycosyltransferase involved in cell wall biosynthesis
MQTRLVKWYIDKSFILTNSSYSAEAIWLQAGKRANVVYPSVDVSRFFTPLEVPRENLVVTCGRFTPEKHLDKIPEIASKVPETQFIITGSTSANGSLEIMRRIQSKSKELMCRNIEIIPNVSLKELTEI